MHYICTVLYVQYVVFCTTMQIVLAQNQLFFYHLLNSFWTYLSRVECKNLQKSPKLSHSSNMFMFMLIAFSCAILHVCVQYSTVYSVQCTMYILLYAHFHLQVRVGG